MVDNQTTEDSPQSRGARAERFIGAFSFILSIIVAISVSMLGVVTTRTFSLGERSSLIDNRVVEVRVELSSLAENLQKLQSRVDAISDIPDDAKATIRLAAFEQGLAALRDQLGTIEAAIVDNPERAMSIPLLRRDLDGLRSDVQGDVVVLRDEIARIYDQNKWFIGLMFTMAVSVIGLAISNVIRGK